MIVNKLKCKQVFEDTVLGLMHMGKKDGKKFNWLVWREDWVRIMPKRAPYWSLIRVINCPVRGIHLHILRPVWRPTDNRNISYFIEKRREPLTTCVGYFDQVTSYKVLGPGGFGNEQKAHHPSICSRPLPIYNKNFRHIASKVQKWLPHLRLH